MIVAAATQDLQPFARAAAHKFCLSASRLDGDKIGWMPTPFYDFHFDANHVVTVTNNGDLVGFAVWSPKDREMRLFQVWVRQDARQIAHGRALVERCEEIARSAALWRLRCWVAQDLTANIFWKAIGFEYAGWRWGRARQARRHNLYRRVVTPLFAAPTAPPPRAAADES